MRRRIIAAGLILGALLGGAAAVSAGTGGPASAARAQAVYYHS